jgi:hypothetical protein
MYMESDYILIVLELGALTHTHIKITNIDIYFLYQIRHVQQHYEGLSVVNIPLILFTIHVIGVFLFKKNKLLSNVRLYCNVAY